MVSLPINTPPFSSKLHIEISLLDAGVAFLAEEKCTHLQIAPKS